MNLDTRWQLFLDDRFFARADGVRLAMRDPVQHPEPVLTADRPWEAAGLAGYNTVLREPDGRFRMWYGAMMKTGLPQEGAIRLCYAESEDGLRWSKPALGLVPFAGSRDTNIVAPARERQSQQGATVYRDDAAPGAERYKLWTKFRPTDAECAAGALPGLYAMHSPDGLRWTVYPGQPNPPAQACDTQNLFFRDPRTGGWAGYTRVAETQHIDEAAAAGRGRYRTIGRIESPDFRNWSATRIVLQADAEDLAIPLPVPKVGPRPPLDFYTSCAMPVPGAQDAYVAFPSVYYHWGEGEAPAALDVRLYAGRDGIAWRAMGDKRPFLRHGLAGGGADGMLYANPWLNEVGNEWWLYYAATSRRHGEAGHAPRRGGICRAAMRRHGLVSADAGYGGGSFVTPPLLAAGHRLEVNADGSAGGWLKVEAQDADGRPLPGFGLDDAEPFMGNALERAIRWRGGRELNLPAGAAFRLRFVMRDIRLYAFRLAGPDAG